MKRSLRDLPGDEIAGRRALVRVDYNVPIDGDRVTDAMRIEASGPTIRLLLERDVRPVLASHVGRPAGAPDPGLSLAPVADELERRLGVRVHFVAPADSAEAVGSSRSLGGEAVLLLENTRFLPGERSNDDELARRLARLGDFFVNDAFGTLHRAHASTTGVARHLRPAVAGLLVERELKALGRLREEDLDKPFVVALGGAKIADKIPLLAAFLERADAVLVGGAMANTFLAARGHAMGRSLVEEEALGRARELDGRADGRLRLPEDLTVTPDPEAEPPETRNVRADRVPSGTAAVDIGERARRSFAREVEGARTLFWNGPMGWFERPPFDEGTAAVARAAAVATETGGFTVVGGGDSAAAVRAAGLADRISHVSTGGGAALAFLAGRTLPGLEALDDA